MGGDENKKTKKPDRGGQIGGVIFFSFRGLQSDPSKSMINLHYLRGPGDFLLVFYWTARYL